MTYHQTVQREIRNGVPCVVLTEMTYDRMWQERLEMLEALRILLVQFGPYVDGEGAAKFHAVNIAQEVIAKAEGRPT